MSSSPNFLKTNNGINAKTNVTQGFIERRTTNTIRNYETP